jgi:hypothetical protein
MSDQSPDLTSRFSPHVLKSIDFLFGDTPPEDLLVRIQQTDRPLSCASRHGYPLGLAKSTWQLRDRITLWFAQRLQTQSRADRIERLLVHEAVVRALQRERILGSFHWAGDDTCPQDTIDQLADNMIHWLRLEGFALVETWPLQTSELPEAPLPDRLVYNNRLHHVLRTR